MKILATNKIASCYNPTLTPGSGRLIEIQRDGKPSPQGDYTASDVRNGTAEYSRRFHTERAALKYAESRGFCDVVYAQEVRS